MRYSVIIELISKHLAGELVSESEMLSYMDRVVDDINARLSTCFPTFTEFKECQFDTERSANPIPTDLDYTPIPDKYIRTVVIPGAAFKYYTTDEEGSYAAPKYEEDYNNGMFYMQRDYSLNVPRQYQVDRQGYVDIEGLDEGITILNNRGLF